ALASSPSRPTLRFPTGVPAMGTTSRRTRPTTRRHHHLHHPRRPPSRTSHRVRHRPTRQTLRLGRDRTRRLRLLRTHAPLLPPPNRTTTHHYHNRAPPPPAQAARGDLLFWSYDRSPTGIHHVAMYLGNNTIIEAQQPGVPVHTRPITLTPPEPELLPTAIRVH